RLQPMEASEDALIELGKAMAEDDAMVSDPGRDNKAVPAGFTYLGQFIDHDITFDPTPIPEQKTDPLALHNFRTPKLDLDSVYGTGPTAQPYLYQRSDSRLFIIGKNPVSRDQKGVEIPEK